METVNGYVEHIIFHNSENGYTVMNLVTEEEEITCVGMCRGIVEGESICAQGEKVEHPLYGSQFKISSYESVAPRDCASMERYLGSGAVKGIGVRIGKKLFEVFQSHPVVHGKHAVHRIIILKCDQDSVHGYVGKDEHRRQSRQRHQDQCPMLHTSFPEAFLMHCFWLFRFHLLSAFPYPSFFFSLFFGHVKCSNLKSEMF